MAVNHAQGIIEKRRSLRALKPLDNTLNPKDIAEKLIESASLAPSADNSQPWRFVAVYEDPQLTAVREALSTPNAWAKPCSLFIVVCASPADSVTGPSPTRLNGPLSYYLYDTGLASAFLMLRATDFGLVAHPIGGFDGKAVAQAIALNHAPDRMLQVVVLLAIGEASQDEDAIKKLPEVFQGAERQRPARDPLSTIMVHNSFSQDYGSRLQADDPSEEPSHFERDIILVNDDGRIYHLDQASLMALASVDELPPEDQVPYGFVNELKDLGIAVAAIPTIPEMNASIFCYLLNLGSLVPPPKKTATTGQDATRETPVSGSNLLASAASSEERVVVRRRRAGRRRGRLEQYSGCRPAD